MEAAQPPQQAASRKERAAEIFGGKWEWEENKLHPLHTYKRVRGCIRMKGGYLRYNLESLETNETNTLLDFAVFRYLGFGCGIKAQIALSPAVPLLVNPCRTRPGYNVDKTPYILCYRQLIWGWNLLLECPSPSFLPLRQKPQSPVPACPQRHWETNAIVMGGRHVGTSLGWAFCLGSLSHASQSPTKHKS